MNATLTAALERAIALLPEASAPTETELGWGRDVACVTDAADDFREIGPTDPAIIMHAIARRLQTPRGTLLDDEDYGFDLRGCLHKPMTQTALRQLQTQTLGEVNKERRIDTSATTVTITYTANTISVFIHTAPRDPRGNPFAFVVRITEAGTEVEA